MDDVRAHLAGQRPAWLGSLLEKVTVDDGIGSYVDKPGRRDVAVSVCAELLGVSKQQVYAQLAA